MSAETSDSAALKPPPRAPGLPWLGNARDLLKDPMSLFVRFYQELGPVFSIVGAGRTYVVLAGPEANRRFHEWDEQYLSSGRVYRPYVDDLGSENVLVGMDGEPHIGYRKWLRPGFSREAIVPHVPRMVKQIEQVTEPWKAGERLNVTDVTQYLIAQVSGAALAGCPADHHFDDARVFAHTFLGAGVGSFPGFMRKSPRYLRARRRFLDFLRQLIASHRESEPSDRQPDLIDLLLRSGSPLEPDVTEADILASAHMPFTNSLVYVAATCGFMLYELLRNPELLASVQAESDEIFANDPLALSALSKAKWLKATLMETQRLHPIALSLPRYVERSFDFEGYRIEAGSMTLTATAATHFIPELFPEPERFDPGRFLPPRREHLQPAALVPYGLGPHACLSAGLVNTFALLCVAGLLHRVELAIEPESYELGISVAPFPAPARDFTVRVVARRAAERRAPTAVESSVFELDEILPEVGSESLIEAASKAKRRHYQQGAVVFREGSPADALYIISDGKADVVKEGPEGEQTVLARLGAGDYFGEIGLLQDRPRTATIVAGSKLETIVLDRQAFVALVGETDLTSGEIAAVMHRRLVSNALAAALPELGVQQIGQASSGFEMITVEPGQEIVRQGTPAEHFYIVVQGTVEVVNQHPDGRELALASLAEGDFFGEIGLLQGQPRNATVRAASDQQVTTMRLGREDFLSMVSDSDATSAQIALTMAERLTELIHAERSS